MVVEHQRASNAGASSTFHGRRCKRTRIEVPFPGSQIRVAQRVSYAHNKGHA